MIGLPPLLAAAAFVPAAIYGLAVPATVLVTAVLMLGIGLMMRREEL